MPFFSFQVERFYIEKKIDDKMRFVIVLKLKKVKKEEKEQTMIAPQKIHLSRL